MPAMRRPQRRPLGLLSGHLGSSVSALLDGQLDQDATERAWQHVMTCPPCRRLLEHEGWVKRQLAEVAGGPAADRPSDRFLGSLLELDPAAAAWPEPDGAEGSRLRKRAGIALVGAGSVSAAVLGLSTLGGAPLGLGGSNGTPASSIGGAASSPSPTRAVVAPTSLVHGRLRGWTLDAADDGVAHAHAVDTGR
jgi:hypothetical protein